METKKLSVSDAIVSSIIWGVIISVVLQLAWRKVDHPKEINDKQASHLRYAYLEHVTVINNHEMGDKVAFEIEGEVFNQKIRMTGSLKPKKFKKLNSVAGKKSYIPLVSVVRQEQGQFSIEKIKMPTPLDWVSYNLSYRWVKSIKSYWWAVLISRSLSAMLMMAFFNFSIMDLSKDVEKKNAEVEASTKSIRKDLDKLEREREEREANTTILTEEKYDIIKSESGEIIIGLETDVLIKAEGKLLLQAVDNTLVILDGEARVVLRGISLETLELVGKKNDILVALFNDAREVVQSWVADVA